MMQSIIEVMMLLENLVIEVFYIHSPLVLDKLSVFELPCCMESLHKLHYNMSVCLGLPYIPGRRCHGSG